MATAGNIKKAAYPSNVEQKDVKLTFVEPGRKTTKPTGLANDQAGSGLSNITRNK
jgi:hypothetical protein